jgi:hypothetical protein
MSGPSYAEITGAGKLLIEKSATFLKFVIFIDGIDEFDGEYKGVSEFFLLANASKGQIYYIQPTYQYLAPRLPQMSCV